MKKKMLTALLSAALIHSIAIPAYAAGAAVDAPTVISPSAETSTVNDLHQYTIQVNGKDTDVEACVFVPLRTVAESLGFTVTWSKEGTLIDNGVVHTTVVVGVDKYQTATSIEGAVGMSAPFSLGAAPYVANDVTYVPLGLFNVLLGNKDDVGKLEGNKVVITAEVK